MTFSAEVYLTQLGDHKVIHDGLKQKAAMGQVMGHSQGV